MKESAPNYKGRGMTLDDIVDHGTPTQKAYKVIMENYDPRKWYDPNKKVKRITTEEKDRILASMKEREWKIFNIYYEFYLTNLGLYIPLSRLCAYHERMAEIVIGEYCVIRAEERLLTDIYNSLPEEHRAQFLKERGKVIDVVPQGDGTSKLFYVEDHLLSWHEIRRNNLEMLSMYMDLKHYVLALEMFSHEYYVKHHQWVTKEALKLFYPRVIAYLIDRAKGDYVGNIVPELSHKVFQDKLKKGDVLGPHDQDRAIVHDYKILKVEDQEVTRHLTTITTEHERVRRQFT